MPNIQRYFGHLAPTLQSLALREPKGSCRQILYFVGLFPKLRDFELLDYDEASEDNVADTFTPLTQPPLDGWLVLGDYKGEKLVGEMATLFHDGPKLRFRCVNLKNVQYTRGVLNRCVDSLETLQLCIDDYGENLFR